MHTSIIQKKPRNQLCPLCGKMKLILFIYQIQIKFNEWTILFSVDIRCVTNKKMNSLNRTRNCFWFSCFKGQRNADSILVECHLLHKSNQIEYEKKKRKILFFSSTFQNCFFCKFMKTYDYPIWRMCIFYKISNNALIICSSC